MERLTEKHYKSSDGYYMKCSETCHVDCGEKSYCEEVDNIVDRLGQIEEVLGEDYDLDRLRELAEADKDGRCFVSDMKLGGKVFYIPKFNGKPYCGIREGHVQAVSFTKVGKRIKIREYHAHNQDFMLGKTVFLTYEAAEAALKGETT